MFQVRQAWKPWNREENLNAGSFLRTLLILTTNFITLYYHKKETSHISETVEPVSLLKSELSTVKRLP